MHNMTLRMPSHTRVRPDWVHPGVSTHHIQTAFRSVLDVHRDIISVEILQEIILTLSCTSGSNLPMPRCRFATTYGDRQCMSVLTEADLVKVTPRANAHIVRSNTIGWRKLTHKRWMDHHYKLPFRAHVLLAWFACHIR